MSNWRPTWVEVSLRQLQDNFRAIRDYVGPNISLCSVVKADAYGHGGVECARALQEAGASWFGVTSTEEGMQLRDAGITARILLMTGIWRGDEPEIPPESGAVFRSRAPRFARGRWCRRVLRRC